MKLSAARKPINLIVEIAISLLLVLSGILLCLACLSIYRSADTQMFTYEIIGEKFSQISVAIYITLGAIVLGCVLICIERISGIPSELKPKATRTPRANAEALAKRVSKDTLLQEETESLAREAKLRKTLAIIDIALCAVSSLLPIVYLINPALYQGTTSAECTKEVLYCIIFYVICLLPAVVFHLLYIYLSDKSYRRETDILKEAIKNHGAAQTKSDIPDEKAIKKQKTKAVVLICVKYSLLAIAIVFIILGITNGGMQDVWKKAAEICAECIGLG